MVTKSSKWFVVVGMLIVGTVLAPGTTAQTHFLYPGEGTSVSLEIFRPHFDDDRDFGLVTGVWFLSGQIRATDRVFVRAEIPMVHVDRESDGVWGLQFVTKETMIGNPYLGVEYKTPLPDENHLILARFGLRPSIASDDKFEAYWVGYRAAHDRREAFLRDAYAFYGGLGMTGTGIGSTTFSMNLGGVMVAPTDDSDSEFILDYDIALWVPIGKFNLGFGGSGRVFVVTDYGFFGDRVAGQLALAGNLDLGKFRPGFHFRVPIDDYLSNLMPFVYGLNFTYQVI